MWAKWGLAGQWFSRKGTTMQVPAKRQREEKSMFSWKIPHAKTKASILVTLNLVR